jgi:hypothetical protein
MIFQSFDPFLTPTGHWSCKKILNYFFCIPDVKLHKIRSFSDFCPKNLKCPHCAMLCKTFRCRQHFSSFIHGVLCVMLNPYIQSELSNTMISFFTIWIMWKEVPCVNSLSVEKVLFNQSVHFPHIPLNFLHNHEMCTWEFRWITSHFHASSAMTFRCRCFPPLRQSWCRRRKKRVSNCVTFAAIFCMDCEYAENSTESLLG